MAKQSRLRIFAAGSLKGVLGEAVAAYPAGDAIDCDFGASGLLRRRIEAGERADLFLSADTDHPQMLLRAGKAVAVRPFAGNELCLLVRPQPLTRHGDAVALLLDSAVTIGTSTPRNDPSGDYAEALFDRMEALRPGTRDVLAPRVRRLTGAPGMPEAPAGRSVYGWLLEMGAADIFVTYRSNAIAAKREVPGLEIVALPSELEIRAFYAAAVLDGAEREAETFLAHLASPAIRDLFASHGFAAADVI